SFPIQRLRRVVHLAAPGLLSVFLDYLSRLPDCQLRVEQRHTAIPRLAHRQSIGPRETRFGGFRALRSRNFSDRPPSRRRPAALLARSSSQSLLSLHTCILAV